MRIPETSRSATTWRGRGMIATIVVIAAALVLMFLRGSQQAGDTRATGASAGGGPGPGAGRGAPANAMLVTVESVTQGPMSIYLDALGTVTPEHTASVYSQVGGRIDTVHYREGEQVRKGQPLIDIDPRPYQAQLTQAQGALARDRAILDQARVNLTRYQAAFDRNHAVSEQQVSDQQATVHQAEGTER